MMVRIEMLRGTDGLRELLRAHGWRLEEPGSGTLHASHPEAGDERAMRSRLHELGLLTSPRLRIEFSSRRGTGVG
jgi:hypothetical protein